MSRNNYGNNDNNNNGSFNPTGFPLSHLQDSCEKNKER